MVGVDYWVKGGMVWRGNWGEERSKRTGKGRGKVGGGVGGCGGTSIHRSRLSRSFVGYLQLTDFIYGSMHGTSKVHICYVIYRSLALSLAIVVVSHSLSIWHLAYKTHPRGTNYSGIRLWRLISCDRGG